MMSIGCWTKKYKEFTTNYLVSSFVIQEIKKKKKTKLI